MDNLYIEKTKSTPEINFNSQTHTLTMNGESYPENTVLFYEPIMQWLEEFITSATQDIVFNVELTYFNSSSSKVLMDIFELLDENVNANRKITVNWLYDEEDESMEEYGEEFAEDVENITFNIKTK